MIYGQIFLYLVILFADTGLHTPGPTIRNLDESCRPTISEGSPFVPPSPYGQNAPSGTFWYGNDQMWTLLNSNGIWAGRGPVGCEGYCTKLIYWARAFDSRNEPDPALTVIVRRLGHKDPLIVGHQAHAVFISGPMPAAMMTMVDIPATGCWEITAKYRDQKLSFVRSVRVSAD